MKHLSTRYLVTFLLVPCMICLYSCKKSPGKSNVHENNEVKATVVRTGGNTVTFNATWPKAMVSQDVYGIGTGAQATNESNERISVSFYTVRAGAYTLALGKHPISYCEYRMNASQVYVNDFLAKDSVNITASAQNYAEGTFACICKTPGPSPDTVSITGSFKGNY